MTTHKLYEIKISASINKFYWHAAPLVLFPIVYDGFCTKAAKLSSGDRDRMAHKAEKIYHLALYIKNLPSPNVA